MEHLMEKQDRFTELRQTQSVPGYQSIAQKTQQIKDDNTIANATPTNAHSILFVIPPYFNADDYLNDDKMAVLPGFTVPYGILSLKTYLEKYAKNSIEIEICDLNITLNTLVTERYKGDYLDVFKNQILHILEKMNPRFVGVSALFNSSGQYIRDLMQVWNEYDPHIISLAGGGLPSAGYKQILAACPDLAICKGEGELPLLEVIDSKDPLQVLRQHKSWITAEKLAEGKIPQHTFISDLDDIPFFNYENIDLDFYNNRSINKQNLDEKRREMAIHTSRGCPFKCVFCSNPSLHGYDVRVMSVPRVIADIHRMKDEFGLTDLLIEDDHFFNDVDRAKSILRELVKLDIRVEFPNGVAVYAIKDDVAKLFSQAGVTAVALAVESGSAHVLNKIIKKPLKTKLIKPAVNALKKYNVGAHVFIVIGLPGETDEHRKETQDMLLSNDFDWVHLYLAMPIVGSRLYDICVENGYIDEPESENFVVTKATIRAPGIDPVQLEEFAYETQLLVNFVHNSNMKTGRYDVAINYLKNVCDKYPKHAFGQYFLSECYRITGEEPLFRKHRSLSDNIFETDSFWNSLRTKYFQNTDPKNLSYAHGVPTNVLNTTPSTEVEHSSTSH